MIAVQTGDASFREIRENGCYYVDKTGFIEELLLHCPPVASLIARPPKFGRTLMLDMLSEFFDIRRDSRALFDGLAISKNKELCDKWMNQQPTVLFSFRGVVGPTYEEAVEQVRKRVGELYASFRFLADSESVDSFDRRELEELSEGKGSSAELSFSLYNLCRMLWMHYGKSAIVLIDEFDVPLAEAQKNGYYLEMIDFVRSMLGCTLKGNERLEFGIVSGCLKINSGTIFSGCNLSYYDLSHPLYADKFGFTSREVGDLLDAAGFPEKKDIVREWYGGYCAYKNVELYCPQSVLQYVDDLQHDPKAMPKPYRKDFGCVETLRSFIGRKKWNIDRCIEDLLAGEHQGARLEEMVSYDAVYEYSEHMWSYLYYAGYLTQTSQEQADNWKLYPFDRVSVLAVPNREVLELFADAVLSWFKETMQKADRTELFDKFWAGDKERLTELLEWHLLKTISLYKVREDYYQAFLAGLFSCRDWDLCAGGKLGLGRPAVVLRDKKRARAAVIEVRRVESLKGLSKAAKEALRLAESSRYVEALKAEHYESVSLWGMAVCKSSCALRGGKRKGASA